MRRNPAWFPEYTQRKPDFNTMGAMRLNPDYFGNQGLVALWLINESGGGDFYDRVSGIVSSLINGATLDPIGGIRCDSNTEASRSGLPKGFTVTYPISMVFKAYFLTSTTTAYATFFSVGDKVAILEQSTAGGKYSHGGYSYSSWNQWDSNVLRSIGYHTIVSSIGNGYQRLWADGALVQTSSIAMSNPTSPSSYIYLGQDNTSAVRNANVIIIYGAVYNRLLIDSEALMWSTAPFGTPDNPRFLALARRTYFVPSGVPSFKPYWIPRKSAVIGGGLR
jgi:hypothetical protein